jgi:carboxyl-terminal processing protease
MSKTNLGAVMLRTRFLTAAVCAVSALAACGGSDDPLFPSATTPPPPAVTTPPPPAASTALAQKCSPNNALRPAGSAATGSLTVEKQWTRAYVNEAYLWYREVPNVDPASANFSNEGNVGSSLNAYFDALTTLPQDRFSFTFPTAQWEALSQRGETLGYGAELARTSPSGTTPRVYRVAYTEPGSEAARVGLQRGDTISSIDGVSINDTTSAGVGAINAGLFPSAAGNHTFVFTRNGVALPAVTMNAGVVTSTPVPIAKVLTDGTSKVGYLQFNDHILTAETQLITAMNNFKTAGINDLVVDLRYNGGGFIFIASQFAYMVAGSARANGKTFEKFQYNDKRVQDNAEAPTPFFSQACVPDARFNCTNTAALPQLNLTRIWVLQGPGTCSASEAIINGLRGVDVEVRTIGNTTCGKPYGFTAKDNCGISYFPIEFVGVNNKGQGDYANGFAATCSAADDFSKPQGDPTEGMLAAALYNRANNSCNPAFGSGKRISDEAQLLRGPERSNKINVTLTNLR